MPDDVRSLYRRWRSRTFGELIGQEHVSRTLLNALEAGRIGHAYLFAGPRGSGKTSTARILAKAVNCLTTGGRGEPCNSCEMCLAINEGRALDLIEIDAASNRGIDEIRDLRDKVHFAPTLARYKVYILDEAHMLTNEAFNALLKTLEEPPAHVIFALVTTEAHKIPPTILSRCQRFDFHRASMKDILAKLNRICQEEQIKVEPAALVAIARSATGSYRDAESLLDQLASFTGEQGVTLHYVQQVLGLAPLDATGKLINHIAQHDVTGGLRHLAEIMQGGADLRQFGHELVDHLRNLMLIKTGNDKLLDSTPDAIEEMHQQAMSLSMSDLVRLIKLFSNPDVTNGLRSSTQPQLPLELALIEACGLQAQQPTAEGGTQVTAMGAPAGRSAGSPGTAPRPATPLSPQPAGPAARPPASPTHTSAPSNVAAPRLTYSGGTAGSASSAARPSPPASSPAGGSRTAATPSGTAPRPASTAPRPSLQPVVTAAPGTPLAIVQEHWLALLEAVKNGSRSVEAFLKECRPIEADEENVVLGFRYPFHKDSVDNPKNRALVEESFAKVLAHPVHIRCTLIPKEGTVPAGSTGSQGKVSTPTNDAAVKLAEELFGAKVVNVEKTGE